MLFLFIINLFILKNHALISIANAILYTFKINKKLNTFSNERKKKPSKISNFSEQKFILAALIKCKLTCFSLSNRSRCSNGKPAPIGLGVLSFSCGWAWTCCAWSAGVSCISSDRTRGIRRKTPFGPFCKWSGCNSIDSLLLRPVALQTEFENNLLIEMTELHE